MTSIAEVVRNTWRLVLDRHSTSDDEHFVDVGGSSLVAARLAARLRKALALDVSIETVLKADTLGNLIAWAQRSADIVELPPLVAGGVAGIGYVSHQLERKLRIAHAARHETRTAALALDLRGNLDVKALAEAVDAVVERHAILSSHFAMSGNDPIVVYDPAVRVRLEVCNLSEANDPDVLSRVVNEAVRESNDIWTGPLGRIRLFTAARDRAVLLIAVDHFAFDGWSAGIIWRELAERYGEVVTTGAAARRPFTYTTSDVARWQRQALDGPRGEVLRSFWREYLQGTSAIYEFPQFRKYRRGVDPYDGETVNADLPVEVAGRLRKLASELGLTTYSMWLSTFILLARSLLGTDDIAVHTSTANRVLLEMEDIIGYFSHGLVLRSMVPGDQDFAAFARANHRSFLSAYRHQDLSFADVTKLVWPDRYAAPPNFSTIYFDVHVPDPPSDAFHGLTVATFPRPATHVAFGLVGCVSDRSESGATLEILFNYAVMDRALATRLVSLWCAIAKAVAERPDARMSQILVQAGIHQALS